MLQKYKPAIAHYLKHTATVEQADGIACTQIAPQHVTLALGANAEYFGHAQWAKSYLDACHRNSAFIERWQSAIGSWDDKVVVDIG
ncbi:MAG: hypothetical protein ACFB0G_16415 [Leptolyngbyaceae cyanobacterium]